MVLQKASPIGLNYGQILASLTLLGALLVGYTDITSRITALETQRKIDREQYQIDRKDNNDKFNQVTSENRDQFKQLSEKVDKLMLR